MPENKGTVLFVSYMFPPVGGAATIRIVKFIHHLRQQGWHIIVLTADKPAKSFYDETLFEELPDDILIYRTHELNPTARYFIQKRRQQTNTTHSKASNPHKASLTNRLKMLIRGIARTILKYIMFPDEQAGWLPFALHRGHHIMRQHDVDVIFSSSAPFTCHIIAQRLAGKHKRPWIADFQDPFVDNKSFPARPFLHRWLLTSMEKRIVHQADYVISVTDPMKELFVRRYSNATDNKWQVIHNGYSEAMFQSAHEAIRDVTPFAKHFELHYTGSLYEGIAPSLMPLFASISQLIDRIPTAKQQFRFILTGNIDNYFLAHIQEGVSYYNLYNIVQVHPPVSHQEAVKTMLGATAFFVTLSHDPKVSIAIHVKIFEYLRARKPILALLPPSAAYDLLAQMDSSALLDDDDSTSITQQLTTWFTAWQSGQLKMPENHGYDRFEHGRLAEKLANLLASLTQKSEA